MELFDIYDQERRLTGRTAERGTKLSVGDFRLVVNLSILNSDNQLLIQQRQPFKEGWPNMWDISAGGSAVSGETSQEAIARETQEEIGLHYDFSEMRPFFTLNFDEGFDDYYMLYQDIALSELRLQTSEVHAVKWATREVVQALILSGEFIPYHKSVIDLLFDLNGVYGGHDL
ncbi:NUDIX hydrolase [Lactococcus carnosus]|uniref:NUDIX hydrolase n=1 Tax=Pseudolactococcus carnosus TaxID=2749961 RepID=UPI00081200F7|nr:NUDIX domain-containing protein [Lactococcus carnosus]SCA92954.1 putative hydrolase (nudix domain) [Lactococcus piscium]MCJ1969062.1 NUDIX domain-containing protein [Lactococcus carnosus]MCJ1973604.1 NUDIX domain-containing protein [Lactococcus carnosus]MCJ1975032.1 NUDIX domain-containing protein [Lactococcus carnosus]MCJ1982248.1 NUDIX domain-containing protein [Lactococcus carnosus]